MEGRGEEPCAKVQNSAEMAKLFRTNFHHYFLQGALGTALALCSHEKRSQTCIFDTK